LIIRSFLGGLLTPFFILVFIFVGNIPLNKKFKTDIRTNIIRPALEAIGEWSPEAEELIYGTGQQESRYKHRRQLIKNKEGKLVPRGRARGYFQMEPATFRDHVDWMMGRGHYQGERPRTKYLEGIRKLNGGKDPTLDDVQLNDKVAAAMARIHYKRRPGAIPKDTLGQAQYWKKHYNTYLGAGTVDEYMKNYRKLMEANGNGGQKV